jgi:hypothetical protein
MEGVIIISHGLLSSIRPLLLLICDMNRAVSFSIFPSKYYLVHQRIKKG